VSSTQCIVPGWNFSVHSGRNKKLLSFGEDDDEDGEAVEEPVVKLKKAKSMHEAIENDPRLSAALVEPSPKSMPPPQPHKPMTMEPEERVEVKPVLAKTAELAPPVDRYS
jgi:hypothetical protein